MNRTRRRPPAAFVALASCGVALVVLPLIGLVVRAPWGSAVDGFTSETTLAALRISAIVSLCATGLAVLFGFPLAWVLARARFRGRHLVRALVVLPVVLPPVVGGIGLLTAF